MTPEAFAQHVADFFTSKGYPFMGIEIKLGGAFPLVLLWDDDVLVTRVIACTGDNTHLLDALVYANEFAKQDEAAGNQPCGWLAGAAWPGGWTDISLDNVVTFDVEGS